jgi:RNA polymerase sigma-70 factor (ECF subfamily)
MIDERVTSPCSEAQLVDLLRVNDERAFEVVIRQYGGRLLVTARRFFSEEQDAKDVVQDALLSAFKAIGGFAGDCKLSTWLHRIVVNCALMRIRSRRRRPETAIDDLLPRFDDEGEWILADRASNGSLEEIIGQRQLAGHVRRCVDQLPDTYRTVLLMRDIEDLDTTEVAELLGITANAVKIRLHRARQALGTLLQEAGVVGKVGEQIAAVASLGS